MLQNSYRIKRIMSKEPSASDFYKCWIAFDALVSGAEATSSKSVWSIISCKCCPEPHCWSTLPTIPLPPRLRARIRWYDNVHLPESSIVADGKLTEADLHDLRSHFVSHHQRIELILLALKPSLERIYSLMKPFQDDNDGLNKMTNDDADELVRECRYAADGWLAVGRLICGVAKLDRIKYLQYVPTLAGVSGGNSPLMMPLTAKTGALDSFFKSFSDEQLAHALLTRTPAGRVAEGFIDCLDELSRCWFDHVVTATTAIGITRGTKGTPNTILVDRVLRRLHGSRLLKALGSLRSPISGIGIEMRQLYDYQHYPLANHYLDLFVDPGCEFGTHSVGFQPLEYELARKEFLDIRRRKRTAIWEHFYSDTRPSFCRELSRLLGLDDEKVGFGLGSSVTEVLSRLIASLRLTTESPSHLLSVVLPDDEFVTLQRAAGILQRGGAPITRVPANEFEDYIKFHLLVQDEKKDQENIQQVIFVSLVNSCTQRVMPLEWIRNLPSDVIVVLDITQAVANIPLELGELAARPNVFMVGSLIKHARCGEGLGFMTYSRVSERLITEPASGWTAYISGIRENKTTDIKTGRLLYDKDLEWDGGTPSWVEASFVASRILSSMPPIADQHEYVQTIKNEFLSRAASLLSSKQLAAVSESNTLALPVSKVVSDRLPFGLDYKIVNGATYLRIGFGIHNLSYHLGALVEVLENTGALE